MTYELRDSPPAADRPHVYHPVNNPDDAKESPWHFAPDEEWGKPVETATLIYAHPDDETIFAGGLMLAYPDWKWTLLRMTGANNERREKDHAKALNLFRKEGVNIQHYCFNGNDEWLNWIGRVHWSSALAKVRGQADVVFTHGYRGEYGHPHHIALHHAVNTIYDNVWHFFHPSARADEPQLLMGRVHVIPTDGRKRAIMEEAYSDMLVALTNADAAMIEQQFSGQPEYFTR